MLDGAELPAEVEVFAQVGSSFGAGMGILLMQWLPEWNIQPGLYAMCAAAAMLGGVFRSSISLVVIVVEGTQARHSSTLSSSGAPARLYAELLDTFIVSLTRYV